VSGDAASGHSGGRDAARWRVPHAAWAYAAAAVFAIAAVALGLQTVRLQQANRSLAERMQAAVDSSRTTSQPPIDLQARVADQQHAIADLEQRLAASAAPDLNAPVVDLEPAERTRTAAPTPAAPDALPSDARTVVFIQNTTHPNRGATYDVDLVAPDNRVMWSGSGLRQSADRTLTLVVPRSLLGAGTHLRLFSQNGPQRTLVEDYPIPVARR
jgi:hypothetical protein